MPETPSPFDDPFADLFGKLPDPRTTEPRTRDAAHTAPTPPPAPARPVVPPAAAAASSADDDAPLTRREQREREAAAQQAAAPSEQQPEVRTPISVASAAHDEQPAATRTPPVAAARPTASTASLEDLFTGNHGIEEVGTVPPPVDKRKRRLGGWIVLGLVVVLLGGIAGAGLWVWNTYEPQIRSVMGWEEPKDYEDGLATGEAVVTVASGDTGASISQTLYEGGVTKTSDAFYSYLIDTGQNPPFVPGAFALQKKMTSEAALAALLDPANKLENSAQLREGLTVDQSLPLLADGIGLPLEDLEAAVADPSVYGVSAESLEGWLFPATYTFDPGATAQDVIQRLVDRTVTSLDNAGVPVDDRERVLNVASIIQREARFEDDFYKVSRVIENRLAPDNQETFGKLQMDSTAQYGYGEMHDGTVSSSAEALEDDNPWNTYVHTGLPIGPISNPGDTAIDAAMHPADGDWLYFVTVNLDTGETVFTDNYADHNVAVAQWQSWCADHPDSGC